jgi:sulfite exporter TauE/SafE
VFTPLLPCGWLYAFVLTAAGTGGVLSGLSVMTAFWLGTVPALLGMGTVLAHAGQSGRRRLPMLTGMTLIVLGLWGVFSRMAHLEQPSDAPSAATVVGKPSCH